MTAAAAPARAATLPGFTERPIVTTLNAPTAMAFAPDGRLFVCEQGGTLRVIEHDVLLPTPFLTLTVDSNGERGLLGIAFDPQFTSNHFLYLYYTTPSPSPHNRISRFTANGNVVQGGSEQALLDLDNLTGATNHNGGAIHFGPDGKLYAAVGENATSSNSQTTSNLLGKILRINVSGNLIPTDNPFVNDPNVSGNNRAIWALGLRNPFSFAFQPGTGRMFINDVGQTAWEEINEGAAGANYGWPICEGPTCGAPPLNYHAPLYSYPHSDGNPTGCAIVGGAFYNPASIQYPDAFVGKYYFSDLCSGFVRTIDPTLPAPIATSSPFASGLIAPVDLQVSADGGLYSLQRGVSAGLVVRYSWPSNGEMQMDFERDGRADVSVFRPGTGTWYSLPSSAGAFTAVPFGLAGDRPVPGDYDGDSTTDLAVWRSATATWYVRRSSDGVVMTRTWGLPGDVPTPGDFDGDGMTDVAVFRPSAATFYFLRSSNGSQGTIAWGLPTDLPVVGDYDADGKSDVAVWRPADGRFYILSSLSGTLVVRPWGLNGDRLVVGDYDNDGVVDTAVFRPSSGIWYVLRSATSTLQAELFGFGSDTPTPADYDGDGRSDLAVWRPANGTFYVLRSRDRAVIVQPWGSAALGDVPVPSVYVR